VPGRRGEGCKAKVQRSPPKKETADVSVKKRKQLFGLRVSYGVR
jgi:hypothetical protein